MEIRNGIVTMSEQEFNEFENDTLIKFLAIQSNRLKDHGDKIWEEIKHFSWVLYILLGAAPLLKFSWKIDAAGFHPIWIKIWPALALFVVIIAISSIYRESKNFDDALMTVIKIEKRLGFYEKGLVSDERKLKGNKSFLKMLITTARGYFIWYFLVLFVIGVLEILYIGIDP